MRKVIIGPIDQNYDHMTHWGGKEKMAAYLATTFKAQLEEESKEGERILPGLYKIFLWDAGEHPFDGKLVFRCAGFHESHEDEERERLGIPDNYLTTHSFYL